MPSDKLANLNKKKNGMAFEPNWTPETQTTQPNGVCEGGADYVHQPTSAFHSSRVESSWVCEHIYYCSWLYRKLLGPVSLLTMPKPALWLGLLSQWDINILRLEVCSSLHRHTAAKPMELWNNSSWCISPAKRNVNSYPLHEIKAQY